MTFKTYFAATVEVLNERFEQAMLAALESGQLGGVGLDVYDKEPLPMDHPLRRFDNAILMSHRGYATVEILSERYEQALNNILDFIDGKPLKLLNPDLSSVFATRELSRVAIGPNQI